jgi:diguanylate cyclase (GGDEF)-like protein
VIHPILKRQLKKLGLSTDTQPDQARWKLFIEKVNLSYQEADQDRYITERSLVLSSAEMRDLNLKLQEALNHLRQLSMTDELTGLMNRRFLNASISEEIAQVLRNYRSINQGRELRIPSNVDIVFVMLDMDNFKFVNDTYGHAAGDRVLIQMRELLTLYSRDTDTVIRWGGEKFLIVARNACRNDYIVLIERIRGAVEAFSFDIGQKKPIHLTCSLGAAVFPFLTKWPDAVVWDQVVEMSDACMYAAKHSGRNAWVGVIPTELTSLEDLTSNLTKHIPDLVQQGKLTVKTSLPSTTSVIWD